MKKPIVIRSEECPYYPVAWGKTKGILAKESVAQSENVQIRMTEYQPHWEHAKHVHPTQEEIIFVLSGRGFSVTDECGRVPLGPGDVSYIPAGVYHATVNPNDEPMVAIIIKTPPDTAK